MPANRFLPDEWENRLEEIDLEILHQAAICKIRLLEPGAVERVLAVVRHQATVRQATLDERCVCDAIRHAPNAPPASMPRASNTAEDFSDASSVSSVRTLLAIASFSRSALLLSAVSFDTSSFRD